MEDRVGTGEGIGVGGRVGKGCGAACVGKGDNMTTTRTHMMMAMRARLTLVLVMDIFVLFPVVGARHSFCKCLALALPPGRQAIRHLVASDGMPYRWKYLARCAEHRFHNIVVSLTRDLVCL